MASTQPPQPQHRNNTRAREQLPAIDAGKQPRHRNNTRAREQLPAVIQKNMQAMDAGKQPGHRGTQRPLATAGNYNHIISTMDLLNKQKRQGNSFRSSLMSGHDRSPSGQADKSGRRPASISSRSSGKMVLPKLPESSGKNHDHGQVNLVADKMATQAVAADTLATPKVSTETVARCAMATDTTATHTMATNLVATQKIASEPVARSAMAAADILEVPTLAPEPVARCTLAASDTVEMHTMGTDSVTTTAQAEKVHVAVAKSKSLEPESNEVNIDNKAEEEGMATLSEESLTNKAKKQLETLSERYKMTTSLVLHEEDGSYTKEFSEHVLGISASYFIFKKYPLRIMSESRTAAGKMLVDSGSVQILCDIVVAGLESRNYFTSEGKLTHKHYKALRGALSAIMNFSDASKELTYAVRDHPNLLTTVLSKIKDWYPAHMDKTLNKVEDFLLKSCMSIIHNIAMRDDNIEHLRQLNASDTLLPYLETTNNAYKLSAVASLADIVTEEEADKLATSPTTVRFLLNRLKEALQHSTHRYQGWSVTELVRAVRQLARNDTNKRLLAEEGALPLLTEGVQSSIEDEKTECMESLWMLSFDKNNAGEILKSEELMDQVVSAYQDHSQPRKCWHSAQGILWQLRDELVNTEKYKAIGKAFHSKTHTQKTSAQAVAMGKMKPGAGSITSGPAGHVMLSYQWADQELVKTVRDHLCSKGFTVWMDIDNMGGSTLQAMAEAIEDAFVVLVCMSQKYKDSPNCRAEAEYAFQQHRKIIPLITQHSYRPDGWLGMILGAKLYYDFSGKYTFESRITQLIRAVQKTAGMLSGFENMDGPFAQKPSVEVNEKPITKGNLTLAAGALPSRPPPQMLQPIPVEKIKTWTRDDVGTWLKKHNLDGTELEKLSGREIIFLYNLRSEAPEYFYNTLEKKLQIGTLQGLISFTDALSDLPTV